MVNNGNNGVLMLATKQSQTEIIKTGGIIMPSPKVNRTRVESTCKYVVVCEESQGNAYLIGEIDGVLWVNGNCVIKISSYALLDKPGIWAELGNRYGWCYLNNPSQMHLYVGRLKFKSIYNNSYSVANSDNGNGNVQAAASDMPTGEVKQSAIVTIPKWKRRGTAAKAKSNPTDRIAALRKELAELEANRKQALHDMIDALSESQVDAVTDWLTLFVGK